MRIATSQFQASMNRSLQINQGEVARLTEQLATGNKIQVPSDEPIANVRLSRLRREENIVSQYVENIEAVKIRLSKNETYLSSMVEDIGALPKIFMKETQEAQKTSARHATCSSGLPTVPTHRPT